MRDYILGLQALIDSGEEKITIARLCRAADKSYSDFKSRFETMDKFATKILEYGLSNVLRVNAGELFSKKLYSILEEIYNRKYYYYTVFNLWDTGAFANRPKNKAAAYHHIEKILKKEIENYIKEDGVLRMRDVRGCSSHICSRILVWRMHEFKDDPATVFHDLRSSLDMVEAAKNAK